MLKFEATVFTQFGTSTEEDVDLLYPSTDRLKVTKKSVSRK